MARIAPHIIGSRPATRHFSIPTHPPPVAHIPEDPYCLAAALQACLDAGDTLHGAAVHCRLLKSPDAHGRAFSLWNKLLNLYTRCGLPCKAYQLFDVIPHRDSVSFNTLISARFRCSDSLPKPLHLYSRMLDEGVLPDTGTLSALLASSESPRLVEQIHAHAVKFGMNSNGFVGSALVKGYARCKGMEAALRGFEEITEPDSVSWNIMMDVCASAGDRHHAVEFFSRMRRQGSWSFDSFALTSVLKTCLEREDLGLGMQLHACSLKAGFENEIPVGNVLVTMYSRCEDGMVSAREVFQSVQEPNIITWTALISGLVQNRLAEEAVGFYKEMNRMGILENEYSFASILPAFSMLASTVHGRMVHCRIIKSEFRSDVEVGNAVIDMYVKCGSLNDALLMFQTMTNRDVVSWSMMISGFGHHGKGREALEFFKAMRERGFKPDDLTFLAGLSACGHSGLVDEGLSIFRLMVDDYNYKPRREHCACIVDMLGRSGRLKEAERFIGEMGLESDPWAWEALLSSCGIHGEKDIGKRSAEKVMELEPDKHGPYVLLSNIYADCSMWQEKRKLRQRLDASGLRKEAASSWFSGLDV